MGVEIPTPDRGVQPQRQGGGAFGSSAFPGLWVLAAKILFHVAVANLDRPAAGVAGGGLGAGGGQVGGEEVVVVLDPVGVADDDQADQTLLVDPVPEHVADVDLAGDLFATLADRGLLPRRETGSWRPRPTVLETPRTRTRRRPIAVAARHDLVLVSRHPPRGPDLDPAALVPAQNHPQLPRRTRRAPPRPLGTANYRHVISCLLYTSDAADEEDSVDLGGRRII